MAEISDAFLEKFLTAVPAGVENYALGRAIGDALEAIIEQEGVQIAAIVRNVHFHPPAGSVLSGDGDIVLIEPLSRAAERQEPPINSHQETQAALMKVSEEAVNRTAAGIAYAIVSDLDPIVIVRQVIALLLADEKEAVRVHRPEST